MRIVLFVAVLGVVACAQSCGLPPRPSATDQYFDAQRVDHFDPSKTDVWSQRFRVNATWFEAGGPVFLFLAGEADMGFFGFQEVSAEHWAEEFGALYVELEHRYYGLSWPVPDSSTDNLRFLTSEQALGDAANFLEWFNSTQIGQSHGPWIVFGCSYSGSLSAWMRAKYPQLVEAAVAPSGPILAKSDFWEFFNQWQLSADPECVSATQSASDEIEEMLLTDKGRAELKDLFNACEELDLDNLYFFWYTLASDLLERAQFENPPAWPMTHACKALTASKDYLKNWGKLFVGGRTNCSSFSEKAYLDAMKQTQRSNGGRSWMWQSCAEFGWFSTTHRDSSVFSDLLDVDHQLEWCEEVFGIPNFKPDTAWTNEYYGGYELEGTNILFTNGDKDPWHRLSATEDLSPGVRAVTYDAGHCAPMTAPTADDPLSLVEARRAVFDFLARVMLVER